MNWYFAISEKTMDRAHHDWRNLIRVAVQSARTNTALKPHLLYDGEESAFTAELRHAGVTVIPYRTPLYDDFKRFNDDEVYVAIAAGAFLRFEIPLIEQSADYVLYTDCDVMFLKEPQYFDLQLPPLFAATSQTSDQPSEDMNSGVMLINVAGMRELYPDLMEFTANHLDVGLDQEVLRAFIQDRYSVMDRSLNWKPYWGINPQAQIVHFHGPKPVANASLSADPDNLLLGWRHLYARSPEAYAEYEGLWNAMLAAYTRQQGLTAAG